MKRNLGFFVVFFAFMGFMNLVNAQKVLVTDDASVTKPATLLHIHKTANGDILQLTNGTTGSATSDGFKIDIDASNNVDIKNQESAAMNFATNGTTRMTIDASGNVQLTGLLSYNFIQGACYIELASYTPAVSQNVYTWINPGMTVSEADGLAISNDLITVATTGHYKVDIVVTMTSGGVTDNFQVKMYKNGSATGVPGSNRISPGGSGQYGVLAYFWYLPLMAGDVLSFYITNTASDNDPTISDMKVYLEKKPQ